MHANNNNYKLIDYSLHTKITMKKLTCELNVVHPGDSVVLVQLTGRQCNSTAVLTSIREVEGVKVKDG